MMGWEHEIFMQLDYVCELTHDALEPQPGSSPAPPSGVLPNFTTSFYPNPLGNGRILLFLFLGQELLDSESLARRRGEEQSATCQEGGKKELQSMFW